MKLDKLSQELLEKISNLHQIPSGAFSLRKNGKSEIVTSSKNIEIKPKFDGSGIDLIVKSSCQNEACHIPAIVTEDFVDIAYNDFYIESGANVTIVAGCGVHSNGNGGHNGVHTFHVGQNAIVNYVENHFASGKGENKQLSPTTVLYLGKGSVVNLNTVQIGGVDYANRTTKAILKDNAVLEVNERICTSRFEVVKTKFEVKLNGLNSKCNVVSRSVATDESEQSFLSNIIGNNACFGHVECDGIVMNKAKISSTPKIVANNCEAELSHEASIGKIAGEQILKLQTLGLTQTEAEQVIIEGFLK